MNVVYPALPGPARWLDWFAQGGDDWWIRDQALPASPKARGRNKLFKT